MQLVPFINIVISIIFFLFWVVAFFILYHLTRFGVGVLPKRTAALFLVGAVALFCTSILFYSRLDLNHLY